MVFQEQVDKKDCAASGRGIWALSPHESCSRCDTTTQTQAGMAAVPACRHDCQVCAIDIVCPLVPAVQDSGDSPLGGAQSSGA